MTRGFARAWLLGMVLVLSGCGSDSETNSNPKVPTVTLDSLKSSEGAEVTWSDENASAELMLPCDGRIVVGASTADWSARAPGGCGQTQLCGHIEAVATAANGATSNDLAISSPLLALPVASLGDWVGAGTVLVRLVKDDNTAYLNPTGGEITSTRNVNFSAPASCDEPSGTGGSGAGGASN